MNYPENKKFINFISLSEFAKGSPRAITRGTKVIQNKKIIDIFCKHIERAKIECSKKFGK